MKSFPFCVTKSGHGQIMENDSVKDEPESKPGMFQRNQVQYSGLRDECETRILALGANPFCSWDLSPQLFVDG